MKQDMLKRLAVKLEKKNNPVFSYPIEKQKKYLNSFREPKNDLERSYNQYCCQMKFNGKVMTVLLNMASLPLLIYFYKKKSMTNVKKEKYDAVFFSEGISEDVIPKSLRKEFSDWLIVQNHGENITKQDKSYFKKLIRCYPVSWHFLLKCLIKIRFYSYEIQIHSPKAIVVCGEYSFTSSVLTDYCKVNNVLHIDVMHGEKLFSMRDSFFRFDRCYVWDQYYEKLLMELRAESDQFKIEVPPSLKFTKKSEISKMYDYTYYLAAENENVLRLIAESLKKLKENGFKIAVRPHPRYSNIEQIKKFFGFAEIEETGKCTIEDSLMRTKCAISLYSTVLNQAICNDVSITIDDVSNPSNFKKLEELGYMCLKKQHKLLSEII